mgnify:FL=1
MTTKHTPIFDNYGNVSVGNYVGGLDSLPDAYALQCSITADLLAALEDAETEIRRLHAVHGSHYSGKIGEPDMVVVDKARAAIARAKGQA